MKQNNIIHYYYHKSKLLEKEKAETKMEYNQELIQKQELWETRTVDLIKREENLEDISDKRINELIKLSKELNYELNARREAENKLSIFKTFAENTHLGLILSDQHGRVVYANAAVKKLLDIEGLEIYGKSCSEVLFFMNEEYLENIFHSVLSNKTSQQIDRKVKLHNGEIINVRIYISPYVNSSGFRTGIVLMFDDVTELRKLNYSLENARRKLVKEHEVLEDKNTMLRGVVDLFEKEREEINKQIQLNFDRSLAPVIKILKQRINGDNSELVKELENKLCNILSPYISRLESIHSNLSPREVEVCNMIREGQSSKEMAERMGVSVFTIHNQRRRIRKKLELSAKKISLSEYLQSIR